MPVEFKDYSFDVKTALRKEGIAFLYEAGDEILSQVTRNYDTADRVDTGQTKGSFQKVVDEDEMVCTLGSSYQNAIWEEFGTGIHAENGNGRKTAWRYKDRHGQWHTTKGKKGHRPFFKAYTGLETALIREAQRRFKEL